MLKTYDHWKTTNPADEFLGPPPMIEVQCDYCGGKGYLEEPHPLPDDPYFCRTFKCEPCDGHGVIVEEARDE